MVHIELDSESCNFKGIIIDDFDSGSLGSGIRRELSFSRWCDDDKDNDGGVDEGRVVLDRQLGDEDVSLEEDTVFELPFVEKNEVQGRVLDRERFSFDKFQLGRSLSMNGSSAMDDDTVHRRGNGSEKYVPFDIEDSPERGTVRSGGGDSYVSGGGVGPLHKSSEDTVPVANILKTMFFIFVWYTFSLFLTL
jgi:solute carrier family 35 protein C2